jgi:hypothetical protein
MPRTANFNVADIRGIFFPVFDRHAGGADLYINVGSSLSSLASKLDRLTANLDLSDNQEAMAELMVMITQLVYNEAGVIYPAADDEALYVLGQMVLAEFSVECAIYFAREQGYSIRLADISLDKVVKLLLLMPDSWKLLTQLFDESLRAAGITSEQRIAMGDQIASRLDSLLRSLDVNDNPERFLSVESYSNLRSEADQRHWTEPEVLMLIEEHLRPHLSPLALHYSETVSGEEWADLYRWLFNGNGGK